MLKRIELVLLAGVLAIFVCLLRMGMEVPARAALTAASVEEEQSAPAAAYVRQREAVAAEPEAIGYGDRVIEVVDPSGIPVPEAQVLLRQEQDRVWEVGSTDSLGRCTLTTEKVNVAADAQLRVGKEGFEQAVLPVNFRGPTAAEPPDYRIVLAPVRGTGARFSVSRPLELCPSFAGAVKYITRRWMEVNGTPYRNIVHLDLVAATPLQLLRTVQPLHESFFPLESDDADRLAEPEKFAQRLRTEPIRTVYSVEQVQTQEPSRGGVGFIAVENQPRGRIVELGTVDLNRLVVTGTIIRDGMPVTAEVILGAKRQVSEWPLREPSDRLALRTSNGRFEGYFSNTVLYRFSADGEEVNRLEREVSSMSVRVRLPGEYFGAELVTTIGSQTIWSKGRSIGHATCVSGVPTRLELMIELPVAAPLQPVTIQAEVPRNATDFFCFTILNGGELEEFTDTTEGADGGESQAALRTLTGTINVDQRGSEIQSGYRLDGDWYQEVLAVVPAMQEVRVSRYQRVHAYTGRVVSDTFARVGIGGIEVERCLDTGEIPLPPIVATDADGYFSFPAAPLLQGVFIEGQHSPPSGSDGGVPLYEVKR